ncbi:MAG: leucine-rich repeat domain-containing protein [Acinetobacter sp.]|uniref:leucine-rich repeat domain-containing protein n=1 Tax=Acinetobacter sp. TaxID=472 RepID=UPI003D09386C
MTIYTGVADANGDFTVPFSSSYTGGEKITVTAEVSGATKSIELFAPSSVIGGDSALQFSGSLVNFPDNCGNITISKMKNIKAYAFTIFELATGITVNSDVITIAANAFRFNDAPPIKHVRLLANTLTSIGSYAFYGMTECTELIIAAATSIGTQAFFNMNKVQNLVLPEGLLTLADGVFYAWTGLKKASFPSTLTSIGSNCCYNWSGCVEIIMKSTTPPTIAYDTFYELNAACVIKVPADSVAAYQAAPNWSAFASYIQAI